MSKLQANHENQKITPNTVCITGITELLKLNYSKYGNIYIVLMAILSGQMEFFGGVFRCMFSKKHHLIKDLDLKWKRSGFTHFYDGVSFVDTALPDIITSIQNFGLEVIVEKVRNVSVGSKQGYFDVKSHKDEEEDEQEEDDQEEDIILSDAELLQAIMYPRVTPGNTEYSLRIKDHGGNSYLVILDISFPKGNETCTPAVEEESLAFRKDISELLFLSESPIQILEKIEKSLEENCVSYLEKDPKLLISNLKERLVTVYDLKQSKRIIKLGKLIQQDFTICGLDQEHKNQILMLQRIIQSGKEEIAEDQQKFLELICEEIVSHTLGCDIGNHTKIKIFCEDTDIL